MKALIAAILIFATTVAAQSETKFRGRHGMTCVEAKAQIDAMGGPAKAEETARSFGFSEQDIARAKSKYRRCPQ